jgi:hypothetical protein
MGFMAVLNSVLNKYIWSFVQSDTGSSLIPSTVLVDTTGAMIGSWVVNGSGYTATNIPVAVGDDGRVRTISQNYLQAISEGDVPNHKRFGMNASRTAIGNSQVDVTPLTAGTYVFPASAAQMWVVSTDAHDAGQVYSSGTTTAVNSTLSGTEYALQVLASNFTGALAGDCILFDGDKVYAVVTGVTAGTLTATTTVAVPTAAQAFRIVSNAATSGSYGIRCVACNYLDVNYNQHEEFVVLNGTNHVHTTASMLRINRLYSVECGSAQSAIGAVTVANASTGTPTVYRQIDIGLNIDTVGVYTVPRGWTVYILSFHQSCGAAATGHWLECRLRVTTDYDLNRNTNGQFYTKSVNVIQDGAFAAEFPVPITALSKSDIKLSAISDASNANVRTAMQVRGWMEYGGGE